MTPKTCPFCDRPLPRGLSECPYCGEAAPLPQWCRIARILLPLAGFVLLFTSLALRSHGRGGVAAGSTKTIHLLAWSIATTVYCLAEARRRSGAPGVPPSPTEGFPPPSRFSPNPFSRTLWRMLAILLPCAMATLLASPPASSAARVCAFLFAIPFWGCVFAYELPPLLLALPPIFLLPALL